jgi:hypothetical protein
VHHLGAPSRALGKKFIALKIIAVTRVSMQRISLDGRAEIVRRL